MGPKHIGIVQLRGEDQNDPPEAYLPPDGILTNTGPAPSALERQRPTGRLTADISNRAAASSSTKDSNAEQFTSNTRLQRSANVSKTQASTRAHDDGSKPSFADLSMHNTYMLNLYDEYNKKDDAAMVKLMKSTLPQFSNEQDWEMAAFELTPVLDRVWPHKQVLDISHYLTSKYSHHDRDMEKRADSLIYFALTLSAKQDSYAKLQIMAASQPGSVPCVLLNEGRKLFQMFQSLFTMTNLHTASLPSVRKQLHDISQKESESVLTYTSRVDIIVATMAKLGEQVSQGAWIYANDEKRQEPTSC